jgi:capsule biosynthesis phosphatase
MRICIDLDGVLCEIRSPEQSYEHVQPIAGAVESLRRLKADGHYVILYTARHMKSTDANIGAVVAKQGLTTLNWLKLHGFEYDEIYFGKPWADVYVDDNAVKFTTWGATLKEIFDESL